MNKKILLLGAAGLVLAAATAAQAQSVDYGSLQQLFNEPVTTSATGSPQRSTEAPADMQIISADEIRRSGETTIPGILQRAAGLDVLSSSAGQSDVNIRGYDQANSPRLLVLVNGRQVYQDDNGYTNWSAIPVQLQEIRQIEVVKGPNAALFGFNAVSGVINIITYDPKYDSTNVGTVQAGLNNERNASLVTTFKLGSAISVRLSGGGQTENEWTSTGPLPTAGTLHNPASAKANLDAVAQLAPKTELRIEGGWSNVQQDGLAGAGAYAIGRTATGSGKATLTSDTDYGLVQASAYQNQVHVKYGDNTGEDWNNTITVADLQDLFKIGANNTFRIGAEYRYNTMNVAPVGGATISYDVWAGSGMWNWAVNKQLTTTLAVRVDDLQLHRSGTFPAGIPLASNGYWDRSLVESSENATIAWRPTDRDTFRLSYGRGIQAPTLTELGGVQLKEGAAFIIGNPNLNPSIATNYEAAYDREFPLAKLGVRLFSQRWTDVKSGVGGVVILPTPTTGLGLHAGNVSNSQMNGAEITLSGKIAGGVNWHGDTTYTDVKDSPFAGVNAVADNVAFQATTPKWRGNVGLDWEAGAWETDANLHYVGTFKDYTLTGAPGGALTTIDTYAALSARVGYRLPDGLTLALSGQNLLQDRQTQTAGLLADREAQFTISKAW
jgi:outer membrane receptor for ferrienterochelin and colicins